MSKIFLFPTSQTRPNACFPWRSHAFSLQPSAFSLHPSLAPVMDSLRLLRFAKVLLAMDLQVVPQLVPTH